MLTNAEYLAALPELKFPVCGRLTRSVGLLLESTGPDLPVGALVKVRDRDADLVCQVVGFQDNRLQMLAIEETRQLAPASLVALHHRRGLRGRYHIVDRRRRRTLLRDQPRPTGEP